MQLDVSNDVLGAMPSTGQVHSHAHPHVPKAHGLSPKLHNADLAPTKSEGRRWGRYSIFALWTNDGRCPKFS